MSIPLKQSLRVGAYLVKNKVKGIKKFPLIVELEPLFACNLACPGCGKIQYPTEILRKRVSVEEAVAAMEECGAPMVSIAGGEPLLHPDIGAMVAELVEAQEVRVPVHERRAAAAQARPVHAVAVLLVRRPHRRPPRAPRPGGRPRGCVRPVRRRDPRGQGARASG